MEPLTHNMCNLFAQLGLPSDSEAIKQFIATHGKLNSNTLISEAQFWTPTQAAFLREEILMDADWVNVIDELNTALHKRY